MKKGLKIFISYSHKDATICEKFRRHLKALERLHNFEQWYDGEILAGADIDKEISANLKKSDIILLLITPDYISSYYCYKKELETAIQRHREGQCVVVPVICKNFVSGTYLFSNLKFVPTDGRPINSFRPQDDGFVNACTGISNLIQNFVANKEFSANKAIKKPIARKGTGKNQTKPSDSTTIKFPIVRNCKEGSLPLTQNLFDLITKYSIVLPQLVSKIEDAMTQQLQLLSTLISSNISDNTILAYEKNNLENYLMQIFTYIQQYLIGIDKTCVHFRYEKDNQYFSFVNIGYPSTQLPTTPIASKGGMIECSRNLGLPIIKEFNKKLHQTTHPSESISRNYITFTFENIYKLYNINISMCISIVNTSMAKSKEMLIPLSILKIDKLIEKLIMQYISNCIQIYPKYNLKHILDSEGK